MTITTPYISGTTIPRADLKGFGVGQLLGGFVDCGIWPFCSGVSVKTVTTGNMGNPNFPLEVFQGPTAQTKVSFPMISRFTNVINTFSGSNVPLRVHVKNVFEDGTVISGSHYVSLNEYNTSYEFKVPLKEIFISLANPGLNITGSCTVIADLIPMDDSLAPGPLTGSGITG